MGLSVGGLIHGGISIYAGQDKHICRSKASATTNTLRQNENLYLKNEENILYYLSTYSSSSLKKICT